MQSELIWLARLDNSPALYFLKKPAGRDITLIMVAASTDRLSFVSTLAVTIALTASKSRLLIAVHTIKTEIAKNSCMLPEGRTSEKVSWLIFGVSIPTKVTASAARTIIP